MRLCTLILEIMGNILMIMGNLDMTCVRGKGTVFKMAAGNIVCTTAWIKMTGYKVQLSFFGFKLIELTPKLIKYDI